ncbi:MAG: succinyldiaminopimelate transaminase [Candidatus Melainabacteria bacterium HGW-Melainabacteria-1]|nr:MAG: succinyldiaminopimelate transaminase [Candidatus Melainabacteria bacterium HGW-Melainabacteria-1]
MHFNSYLVESRTYFVSALHARLKELKAQGKDVISLIMGDPLEPTYPPVREAVQQALSTYTVSQYPKTEGDPAFRQAVADWAQRYYGVSLDPETQIISCNGSKEAIFHLPLLFDWSKGKEMWIPSLSYPVYAAAAGIQQVPVRLLPLNAANGFLPDLDSFTPEDWSRCQVFWINSPHNPTTSIASKAYLEKLLALAKQYDFLVCSDECYNELYYTETPPASCLEIPSDHVLIFRSLSKRSHMTGYRMGALISHNPEYIRLLNKMRAPMGVGTPDFIQAGGIAALADDQHPRDFAERYRVKRDRLVLELEAKGFKVFGAQAGFYLWFSHPALPTSEDLLEAFIEAGLLLTPGTAFGPDGEGYIRLTYCVTNEICDRVAEAIQAVKLPA